MDGRLALDLEDRAPRAPATADETPRPILTAAQFRQLEAENIRQALREANGRIYGAGGAAALLALKPTTLASRMKSLGITTVVSVQ